MPTLKLFGGILLEDERGLLNATAQRRPLALLALLAVSHPRPVSRDKLIGYLWAERDLSSARNVLNQVTHTLRRALGGGVVVSAGDELRLESGSVTVDVNDFEGALAAGELERAVRLYSGPLLDGFFLTGAPEFERWLEDQRERFRRAYCRALERLAEAAELGGDPPVAAEWWKRLALEEPHSSRVMLRLMQTLAATGDSAEAIRHARGHAARLRDELDMEPALEVTVLAERLRRVVPAVLPSASDPADLTDAGAGAPPVPRSATALDSSSGAPVADPVAASFSAQEIQDVLGLSASPPLRRFPPPRVRAQAAMALVAIIA